MRKAYVKYSVVGGVYHIAVTINGSFDGGGNTGCRSYEEAYNYASKVVASKNARLEFFGGCND